MATAVAPAPTPLAGEVITAGQTTAAAATVAGEAKDPAHLEAAEKAAVPAAASSTSANMPASDPAPSSIDLASVANLPVFDQHGAEVKFGSLFAQPGQHLIIFVRHFLCGLCEDFTRSFVKTVPPAHLPAQTTVHFIGCGDPSVIASYVSRTKCPFPILADPSQALYNKLGMTTNLRMGNTRPGYQTDSTAKMVVKSLGVAFGNIPEALKSGPSAQLGGEMVVRTAEQGNSSVEWCHWMKHTRGHVEPEEIRTVLGLV